MKSLNTFKCHPLTRQSNIQQNCSFTAKESREHQRTRYIFNNSYIRKKMFCIFWWFWSGLFGCMLIMLRWNLVEFWFWMDLNCCYFFYIFNNFSMTEYLTPEWALSVRVYVCLSVRVFKSYNFRPIFYETWTTWLKQNFGMRVFSDYENLAPMTS